MSTIRETVFDLLFNAFLLIGVFSIIAAVFSRLVARARAKYQYLFYVAVFVFCLAMPVVNTFWRSHVDTTPQKAQEQVSSQAGGAGHFLWQWRSSMERKQFTISPEIQNWIVGVWALFVLYRLVHSSRSVYRVRRVRKGASVHPLAAGTVDQIIGPGRRVLLLESAAIDDPVTVGVFHPAILLPSKVVPRLCEQDLLAILAHEYGHIRRGDFLVNILCELLALPMVWHPGIRYLKSKISQTRELACDDYAAARLGKRRLYASSLVRLASLCLHTPRGKAIALGIFDGDNLEERIMMLTEKRRSLTRAGVVGLTLAMSIPFGAGAVLAQATSLEAGSAMSKTAEGFAGTWYWMFNGKSFPPWCWSGMGPASRDPSLPLESN